MSAAEAREATVTAAVDVTFLRMDAPPEGPGRPLPRGAQVVRVQPRCTVPFYRFLYNTVGQDYLWWLRRAAPDAEIAAILAHPGVTVHVLYLGGQPAGFYELDRRAPHATNLSYFGLMPFAIGRRLGTPFLRHAVDTAWAEKPRALTVNTCTADHPRALPGYLAAGFRVLRTVRELWPIPVRLGLHVPDRLRAG
ncbi:GNAT family N-acetyltransferase [Caldovatus aquaticus]|uniref:GNAT family N-acetyltransferase n=1 Tax=Caldovatus aquaticus TaxID=2865671 RepID=A0ABS7F393_9PROT|nr:GNAT family N-acetyltransferase [Caldovatus aquaticus]MBW8270072.1 GNAT family N-acetyltransferase [Caldovatus aquaticus]